MPSGSNTILNKCWHILKCSTQNVMHHLNQKLWRQFNNWLSICYKYFLLQKYPNTILDAVCPKQSSRKSTEIGWECVYRGFRGRWSRIWHPFSTQVRRSNPKSRKVCKIFMKLKNGLFTGFRGRWSRNWHSFSTQVRGSDPKSRKVCKILINSNNELFRGCWGRWSWIRHPFYTQVSVSNPKGRKI
jgi:ribosome-associated toxin RatA of RatAB toxin-antitoxin module